MTAQAIGTKERSDVGILPPGSLQKFFNQSKILNGDTVSDVLGQFSGDTVIRTNRVFTLFPSATGNTNYSTALDYAVPQYSVEQTNLCAALHLLCLAVPFTLEVVEPVVISRKIPPDLRMLSGHWNSNEIPMVSLNVTNARVRDILSSLVNPAKKAYWVAQPVFPPSVANLKTNLHVIELSVHHSLESRSVSLLTRDPPRR